MKRIIAETKKKYEIIIDKSFDGLQDELSALFSDNTSFFIVTDENVGPLYADMISGIIGNGFGDARVFTARAGENNKNIDTLSLIYKFLLVNNADRSSVILALGGGVIGDIAGFAAATYMRGIRYVQIPTTLLAQVDSSVGGKTAIDFSGYKNIVGAFYQPDLVYINAAALETLPEREFSSGMAEVIKYGLIADKSFYDYIIENADNVHNKDVLTNVISRCVEIKADIVGKDENDTGIREILNFGHTVGHAVEALMNFELLHGEAVALGMAAAIEISRMRGNAVNAEQYSSLINSLNLPMYIPRLRPEQIYDAALKDKKVKSGKLSYVLLDSIGSAYRCRDVERTEILQAARKITKEG